MCAILAAKAALAVVKRPITNIRFDAAKNNYSGRVRVTARFVFKDTGDEGGRSIEATPSEGIPETQSASTLRDILLERLEDEYTIVDQP